MKNLVALEIFVAFGLGLVPSALRKATRQKKLTMKRRSTTARYCHHGS